jgi:hypothetical protein
MQEVKLIDKRSKKVLSFTGPGNWEELSKEQFLAAINSKIKIESEFEQAIVLAQIFFDIPLKMVKQLTTVQAIQLAGVVNFLYEAQITLSKWHLPFIFRIGKPTLAGPTDRLGNLSFGELMFADLAVSEYQKTKNVAVLDKLIVILYREKNNDLYEQSGDYREKFNKNLVAQRLKDLGEIAEEKRQAVLINYIGCRELMSKSFKNVFPERKTEEAPAASKETWLDVAIQLARKEKALGTIKEVEETNAWLVLKVLDKVIQESEELQAELDKMKS